MATNPSERRVALVTGGARGIAHGVALELAERDVDVALCYRTSREAAEATVATLQTLGVRALAIRADVSDPDQARVLVEQTTAELGAPTLFVHGAGPYQRGDVLDETPEGWRAMMSGNLDSLFYCARLVAPGMIAKKRGRIVAFGMANADRAGAFPGVAAHYIAKVGVITLIRQLAKALAPHGITANSVSPGYIDSGSTTDETRAAVSKIPAGRVGTIDDVVAAVMFLISDEAAYVNGTNLIVSGGWGI